jgi:hypothetical protein
MHIQYLNQNILSPSIQYFQVVANPEAIQWLGWPGWTLEPYPWTQRLSLQLWTRQAGDLLAIFKVDKLDQDKDPAEDLETNTGDFPHQHHFRPLLQQGLEGQTMQQQWLILEPQGLVTGQQDSLGGVQAQEEKVFKERPSRQHHHNMERQQQLLVLGPTNQGIDKEQESPSGILKKIKI